MMTDHTTIAPEIVAITAAREVSDRERALAALSPKWSLAERMVGGLVPMAVFFAGFLIVKYELIDIGSGVLLAFLTMLALATVLWLEVFRLRRRLNAVTYLLLQRERPNNEP
jgi:hypothetical protein